MSPQPPTILCVDDEAANLKLLEDILVPRGYTVVRAVSGQAALKALTQYTVDLVLLDVIMPGLDGFEVCRQIKQAQGIGNIPVIMVTALSAKQDRIRAIEAGAEEFLNKPIDRTEALARISSLLRIKALGDAQRLGEAALQLSHDELEQRVQERTQELALANTALLSANNELKHAYDATISGWSRALELRDKETEGHSRRVTAMTVSLARAFGLAEQELVQIRWGSLLHDIGKMGIEDAILLKPGPLTSTEMTSMQQHPSIAHELLAPIRFLRLALDIPYCHHEKWDGTGYPQGLVGEAIPFCARIFAVADVWDALRSDRPYRPAWPVEKVRAHILALSGTHFDPAVVELFMRTELAAMVEVSAPFAEANLAAPPLSIAGPAA